MKVTLRWAAFLAAALAFPVLVIVVVVGGSK